MRALECTFRRKLALSIRQIALATVLVSLLPGGIAFAESELDETSPLYTEYNTFIKASNFLELVSVGTAQVSAKVSFFQIDGTFQKAVRVSIDPQSQVDLDVNALVGRVNTYGIVKVEFNNANVNARLQGRMSIYRLEENGVDFSFAYALPLRAPLAGASYVTSNTYDPQGRGFVVPNWVSVTNLADSTQDFSYRIYDQAGTLLRTETLTLAANERRDVQGEVGTSEAVFLNEVVPNNPSTPYLAGVVRYASNTKPGGNFSSYLYAMPIFARAGTSETQFMPISNREEDCWSQTNWVEVLNVSNAAAPVTLKFRGASGELIASSDATLAARSQFHFNASSVLGMRDATIGSVSVETSATDAIVSQSVVYFHNCSSNALQAAYNIPGTVPTEVPLTGSFNRFIDIENELITFGTGGLARTVALDLFEGGENIHSSSSSLSALGTALQFLNEDQFNTTVDTYGLIRLDSTQPYPFIGYNLRVRKTGQSSEIIDFVVPIPVR